MRGPRPIRHLADRAFGPLMLWLLAVATANSHASSKSVRFGDDPPAQPVATTPTTVPDLPEGPPALDAPRLPSPPIVAACGHLLTAETRRISLPAKTVELQQALSIASLAAALPIEGDWSALDAIGIRANDRVQMPTQAGSLPVILDQVMGQLADAWERPRLEATADGLVITSEAGASRLSGIMSHPIGDLLVDATLPSSVPTEETPVTANELAELVRLLIEPDGWLATGGRLGRMQALDTGLLVTAPPSVQIQVRRLLDQFRLGRPHDLEARVEVVGIDSDTARRLETSSGPGTIAAVRAVREASTGETLFDLNVVTAVDGEGAASECRTKGLEARVEILPAWDSARRRLRCRLSVELDGEACDGHRTLVVDQEVSVPVGGLVIPLPRTTTQSPLALLMIIRAR